MKDLDKKIEDQERLAAELNTSIREEYGDTALYGTNSAQEIWQLGVYRGRIEILKQLKQEPTP